jgi:hypothetical protein
MTKDKQKQPHPNLGLILVGCVLLSVAVIATIARYMN